MQIEVLEPIVQTWILVGLLGALILLTVRKATKSSFFPNQLSTEIKGFAILAIILAHVGYYLSKNTQFLFPISILAGVGVNLFFFLAGYGLTVSHLKRPLSIKQFYLKRLKRLFIPLWFAITLLFLGDFLVLHQTYPLLTIIESYLGIYPKADLFLSFNAPLWYFTMILFYYLIFPLTFFKKARVASPILIYLIFSAGLALPLPLGGDVIGLYKVHSLAFPIGVAMAFLTNKYQFKKIDQIHPLAKLLLIGPLIYLFGYLALNSGVGQGVNIEQAIGILTTLVLIVIALLKPVKIGLFELLGAYSYEIYLLHWPILYRYDLIYKVLPASVATFIYLGVFMAVGWLVQQLLKRLS